MSFALRCLLCGATPADVPQDARFPALVWMQQHAMDEHGVDQQGLVGGPRRHEEYTNDHGRTVYVYRFANGTAWLEATELPEETPSEQPHP